VRDKNSWLVFLVVVILCCCANVAAQVRIELEPKQGTNEKKSYALRRQIPEATLPCTPEVKTWWDALRDAGDAVRQSRGSDGDRKKFAALLEEGAAKSFKPPVEDRKPLFLVQVEPRFTEDGRRHRINGTIRLRVEFRADGTVGEVTPKNSLGHGLDEAAVEAARKAVFLPAIENGEFVSFTTQMEMSFHVY